MQLISSEGLAMGGASNLEGILPLSVRVTVESGGKEGGRMMVCQGDCTQDLRGNFLLWLRHSSVRVKDLDD